MISTLALAKLLSVCAPAVGTSTMLSVIAVESGGRPFAVDDNTTGRLFYPISRKGAIALSVKFLARGDSVDLGLTQINNANLGPLHLRLNAAFDSCRNVHASSIILRDAYTRAIRRYGRGRFALRRALSEYNSGSLTSRVGEDYARSVLLASRNMPRMSDGVAKTMVPSL